MRVSARPARALVLAVVGLAVAGSASARAASVYVTLAGSSPGVVYSLPIGSGGSVPTTTPSLSTYTNAPGSGSVSPAPGGRQVYVAAGGDLIDEFGVGAGGALDPLTPASVGTGHDLSSVVVAPDGKNAYAVAFKPSASPPSYVVDQFTVQSNGKLTAMSPASVTAAGSDDLVMTPDGRHLYVSNFGDPGLIDQYDVAANGTLSAMSPPTVGTGLFPLGMAVTPDGHSLYVGIDSGGGLVEQFNIGPHGALSAKKPATVSLATNGAEPDSIAVSPNGKNLYVGDDHGGTAVEQFTIGSGGRVTAMNPPYVGTSDVSHVVVSPDGKSLYATADLTGTVRYSVGAGGALTLTHDLAPTGQYAAGLAISPDQGPTAEFVARPAAPGHATVLSGAASHDTHGKIARYAWTFGDGRSATTTSPTVHHVYARAGHYVVTLTVTDNDGASTQQVFTGHQVLLNGGRAARITHAVVIVRHRS
jgi:DNA-binding beta-propeller fold protein YncE